MCKGFLVTKGLGTAPVNSLRQESQYGCSGLVKVRLSKLGEPKVVETLNKARRKRHIRKER